MVTSVFDAAFERDVLPQYLQKQRWFADKNAAASEVQLFDGAPFTAAGTQCSYSMIELPALDHAYFVPLAIATAIEPEGNVPARAVLSPIAGEAGDAFLCDGFAVDAFVHALFDDVRSGRRRAALHGGTFAAYTMEALKTFPLSAELPIRRMNVEQSNTSVVIDERIMLKGYRRANRGPQPELEVARFLAAVDYGNTPALLGYVEYEHPPHEPTALAILQLFAANQGDGWAATLAYLERFFGGSDSRVEVAADVDLRTLGIRTAQLHRAFATPVGDPAFEPEPVTVHDLEVWAAQARETAERALNALEHGRERIPPALVPDVDALVAGRGAILARFAPPKLTGPLTKTRHHGDYHLGQVLVVGDDFLIVDFEGEPGRDLATRRRKSCPMRDVAGMLRSIDYAAAAGMRANAGERAEDDRALEALAHDWKQRTAAAFLDGYRTTIAGCSSYPGDVANAAALLDLFVLEKACYEISYEVANRPAWLGIPVKGIRAILDA